MIQIKHADKYYNRGRQNQLHVINGIDLALPDTGMVAIFGRSGCGKTTLLNTIGGLDSLDQGEVMFGSFHIDREMEVYRNKYIGYIFQNYNLNRDESVYENVADALRLCGMNDERIIRERVTSALTNVDMERYANRLPDTLSGGQQQRVAIARAIVKSPSVILADEPTGNLDETNTVLIMDLLKALSNDRLILLVTHEANLVNYYCDRVIELLDGRVVKDYVNDNADGYAAKNKNDIFLGELPCSTTELPGVQVEYYGDPKETVRLKIVSYEGRLYLRSDTPALRVLDASSEVRLREGVFHPAGEGGQRKNAELDMSHLASFEGHHFGRLFNFKKSLALAWQANYGKKKRKRERFLRLVLVLMAAVLVFLTASTGVAIKEVSTVEESVNPHIFFIEEVKDTEDLSSKGWEGTNGIDYAAEQNQFGMGESYAWFEWNNFISDYYNYNSSGLSSPHTLLPVRCAATLEVAEGKGQTADHGEIVITTAVADYLLKNSPVDFLNDYSSLIGLFCNYDGWTGYVVGIVRSEERLIFSNRSKGLYGGSSTFLVHSTDPAATEAFLTQQVGADRLITASDIVQQRLANDKVEIIMAIVGIAVIVGLLSLSVFFLMRSAMMTRVKEIGIYRAIGVSRKNLVFRFFVESLFLMTMTVFIGYLFSSLFIGWLGSVTLISDLLYFPFWLAIGVLVIIASATVFAGILPVMLLLRKTPAAILAKYDI